MEEFKEEIQEEDWWGWIVIGLFIVFAIVIYVGSLGTVDLVKTEEKKQSKSSLSLAHRHRKLKELIEKKEVLHKKLKRRFRRLYFIVRFMLGSIYISFNVFMYYQMGVTDLGTLLNYNELAILLIAVFSFIAFGSLNCVHDFINSIKQRNEVWVYGKYISIESDIENHKLQEKETTFQMGAEANSTSIERIQ